MLNNCQKENVNETMTTNNTWQTTEPPKDGSEIVAIGRVISTDETETWVEPFLQYVRWSNKPGESEGWHLRNGLALQRTLSDQVKIDFWNLTPE